MLKPTRLLLLSAIMLTGACDSDEGPAREDPEAIAKFIEAILVTPMAKLAEADWIRAVVELVHDDLGRPIRVPILVARGKKPGPTVAIYSKADALVPWHNASEPDGPLRESVEVRGTHSGLALNPAVIEVVAHRLPVLSVRSSA